jgi:hypothetical protein
MGASSNIASKVQTKSTSVLCGKANGEGVAFADQREAAIDSAGGALD